jgi:hypothetical protein
MKDRLTLLDGLAARYPMTGPTMLYLNEELERCRRRRIQAWEELEEYEGGGPVTSAAGLDLTNILIERAKADIELFDYLIASLEALVQAHSAPA